MTDAAWGTLSNQAVAAAAVVYFLALLAHVVEWASLRQVDRSRVLVGAGGPDVGAAGAPAPDVERQQRPGRDVRPARPAAHRARGGDPLRRPASAAG